MPWYAIAALGAGALLLGLRLFQAAGERRDAWRLATAARHVGSPGQGMHVRVRGGGPGPTVVIEQGAGGFGALWWAVQDAVAEFAPVITYDRRGLGLSEGAPSPRTVDDCVTDLAEMLRLTNARAPYLLVAHSYGGLLARLFARERRGETAALVLVDSVEEGIHFRPDVLKLYRRFEWLLLVLALAQYFGLPRLWRTLSGQGPATDARLDVIEALMQRPRAFLGMRRDLRSLGALAGERRSSWDAGTLGDLPLIVITHGQPFPGPLALLERYWHAGQERLARLSTAGELIVARDSNHMIQDDEPALVVTAIRRAHDAAARRSLARRGMVE
jgi:pimeloyl-ACP methyl ester carboxylesterase